MRKDLFDFIKMLDASEYLLDSVVFGDFVRCVLYPLFMGREISTFNGIVEIWFKDINKCNILGEKLIEIGYKKINTFTTTNVIRNKYTTSLLGKETEVHLIVSKTLPSFNFLENKLTYMNGGFFYDGDDSEKEKIIQNINNKVLTATDYFHKKMTINPKKYILDEVDNIINSGWTIKYENISETVPVKNINVTVPVRNINNNFLIQDNTKEGFITDFFKGVEDGVVSVLKENNNKRICPIVERTGTCKCHK